MGAFRLEELLFEGEAFSPIAADAAGGDDAVAGDDGGEVTFTTGPTDGAGAAGEVDLVGDLAVGGNFSGGHAHDFFTDLTLEFGTDQQDGQLGVGFGDFLGAEGGGRPLVLPLVDDIGRFEVVEEGCAAEEAVFGYTHDQFAQRVGGGAPQDALGGRGLDGDGHALFLAWGGELSNKKGSAAWLQTLKKFKTKWKF